MRYIPLTNEKNLRGTYLLNNPYIKEIHTGDRVFMTWKNKLVTNGTIRDFTGCLVVEWDAETSNIPTYSPLSNFPIADHIQPLPPEDDPQVTNKDVGIMYAESTPQTKSPAKTLQELMDRHDPAKKRASSILRPCQNTDTDSMLCFPGKGPIPSDDFCDGCAVVPQPTKADDEYMPCQVSETDGLPCSEDELFMPTDESCAHCMAARPSEASELLPCQTWATDKIPCGLSTRVPLCEVCGDNKYRKEGLRQCQESLEDPIPCVVIGSSNSFKMTKDCAGCVAAPRTEPRSFA